MYFLLFHQHINEFQLYSYWSPIYYHRADSFGSGFDRTATGSDALMEYTPELRKQYEDMNTSYENSLLCFHHVSWKYKIKSGRTLWDELCFKYNDVVLGGRKIPAGKNVICH